MYSKKKQNNLDVTRVSISKTKKDRMFQFLLDDQQSSYRNKPYQQNKEEIKKQQYIQTLNQMKLQIHHLKEKDAINRLNISKLNQQNENYRKLLSNAQAEIQKNTTIIRQDRSYINALDNEIRRLKQLKGERDDRKELRKQQRKCIRLRFEDKDYEKQNIELIKQIQELIYKKVLNDPEKQKNNSCEKTRGRTPTIKKYSIKQMEQNIMGSVI